MPQTSHAPASDVCLPPPHAAAPPPLPHAPLQGAMLPEGPAQPVAVDVQWDFFEPLHRQLAAPGAGSGTGARRVAEAVGAIERVPAGRRFAVQVGGAEVVFSCRLNTVVAMGPHRLALALPRGAADGGSSGGSSSGAGSSAGSGTDAGSGSGGRVVWVRALAAVRDDALAADDHGIASAAAAALRDAQRRLAATNNLVGGGARGGRRA